MSKVAVADIISGIRDLPSLPAIVMELLESFERADVNTAVLAGKVARDQALAAKTLRLANSSFYGLPRKVVTIQQAITVLGFDSVRTLVSAASLIDVFPETKISGFDFKMFWRHSIGTALCARLLAKAIRQNENYAFICGLLHDIGRLVLVTRFPMQYAEVLAQSEKNDCHIAGAEKMVLGVDHMTAGRLLAEAWKFPVLMQKAIAAHHGPDRADAKDIPGIVHLADAILHGLDLASGEAGLVPPLSESTWKAMGSCDIKLDEIYAELEAMFDATCMALEA